MTTRMSSTPLTSLDKQKYISLTTFRRSGEPVATPVWFVLVANAVYFYSDAAAGKVKRIRNNSQVQLAACTVRGRVKGPIIRGVARIITDPHEQARIRAALDAKYHVARRLLKLLYATTRLLRPSRPPTPALYLAVTPASARQE
jgi:uncharacterized protein